ncbi:MAG: hypothetical protein QM496_10485, partial [Verrucomicrobiota bacterium]
QTMTGLPCWILPEINGASLDKHISNHIPTASNLKNKLSPPPKAPSHHLNIYTFSISKTLSMIGGIALSAGAVMTFIQRRKRNHREK